MFIKKSWPIRLLKIKELESDLLNNDTLIAISCYKTHKKLWVEIQLNKNPL